MHPSIIWHQSQHLTGSRQITRKMSSTTAVTIALLAYSVLLCQKRAQCYYFSNRIRCPNYLLEFNKNGNGLASRVAMIHISTNVNKKRIISSNISSRSHPLSLLSPTLFASATDPEEGKAHLEFEPQEMAIIDNIWNAAAAVSESPNEIIVAQTLQTFLPQMSPAFILKLRQTVVGEKNVDDKSSASYKVRVLQNALNQMLDQKLQQSRDLLHSFLTAGEIRKLDGLIGKAAKAGKLDSSFFAVINANINDAYKEQQQQQQQQLEGQLDEGNEANRFQILRHIYTRCQEEVEKNVQPGLALLNKLLRTDQASIRANQLRHYLGKQQDVISTPDGKQIQLKNTAAALVPPSELLSALANAVAQIRQMEKVGGTDRQTGASLVESCRQMAMEARLVVGELYGVDSEELTQFETGLTPVFRPNRGSIYSPE